MYSNTGFLAEGFARWGLIGCIIVPLIYVIVLRVLNKGAKKQPFAYMVSISIIPIMLLNDGFLIPSLTFGAIGVLCIISMFFNIEKLDLKKFNIWRK